MDVAHTIGKLARTAGVPTSTVRYYERRGLLNPDARTPGSYRVYGSKALERLRFIRAAQANGFSLEDVSTLLRFEDGRIAPCREVQSLIERRLADMEKRLEEVRQVRAALASALEQCRQGEASGRCRVVDTLHASASARTEAPAPRRSRKR